MATIKRFEDLKVWQEGRVINKTIYKMTRRANFSKDYALKNQIRRASISINANIAEGFERGSNAEFNYFLSIAKSTAGEVLNLLYVALDEEYIPEIEFNAVYEQISLLMRRIGSFMKYLQESDMKGSRYKTKHDRRANISKTQAIGADAKESKLESKTAGSTAPESDVADAKSR